MDDWLVRANARTVRSIQGRPVDLLATDYLSMIPLPPVQPPTGLTNRIRLGRDYYVRVDTVDYSVDPRSIGRLVDVNASLNTVTVFCDGQIIAHHDRSWAKHGLVTDPVHKATAHRLRQAFTEEHHRRQAAVRHHTDGHTVALRALPDYDALFGVDFTNPTTKASHQ